MVQHHHVVFIDKFYVHQRQVQMRFNNNLIPDVLQPHLPSLYAPVEGWAEMTTLSYVT